MDNKELLSLADLPYVSRMAVSDSGRHAIIENKAGKVFVVSQVNRFGGVNFEASVPIVPNMETGSGITTHEDEPYWNPHSLDALKEVLQSEYSYIPNHYPSSALASIKLETFESAINRHGNTLGYKELTTHTN